MMGFLIFMNEMWIQISKNDESKTDAVLLKRFANNNPLNRKVVLSIMTALQYSRPKF